MEYHPKVNNPTNKYYNLLFIIFGLLFHYPPTSFINVNLLGDIDPFLVYMFNKSLTEGHHQTSQKRAIVFPALKESDWTPVKVIGLLSLRGSQADFLMSGNSIYNAKFLYKILKRLVSIQ